jgi:glycosyltransferase involved in cell wall biosynthesis
LNWRVFRWHNLRFQRRVEREFAHRWSEFDCIYVQSNVMLAAKIAERYPTVLMLPGPVGREYIGMLRTIDAVCAHDDGFVQMRARLGDKITELPLGLDTQLFSPGVSGTRGALGWTDRHQVIGYVGRLHPIKGVDLLSTAFRCVSKKLPSVRLLIVGSGEQEKNVQAELRDEIAKGLVHVETSMEQHQLPDWYRAIDLLVMPSRYETMSNSVLEAMACQVPFLASDVGGNKTLGATGAGWLFESGSARSLVARLVEILQDGSELELRGNVGLRHVQRHHSWSRTAERLEQIVLGARIQRYDAN